MVMDERAVDGQGCPCGSGKGFAECCGPYLAGEAVAATAETLMRSRFTAYAREAFDYLKESWHPATRPPELRAGDGAKVEWTTLEVVDTAAGGEGDEIGEVEFIAHYLLDGKPSRIRERSQFVRQDGRWYYVDGREPPQRNAPKVGRNEPCPCGSGKKYKKCCGA
ncbi:YchJ family protein [Endothiovibrio diazotrophicus]